MFGKPIVFGPHMQNFQEIADAFLDQRRGGAGAVRARARGGAADAASPIRCAARGSAPRPARSSKPTAAPRTRRSPSIAELLPPAGRRRRRPALPTGALILNVAQLRSTARRPRGGGDGTRAIRRAQRRLVAPGHQRRQPARRRQRQDAGRRAPRAAAASTRGERPAILTRGYAPARPRDGVTVVSDGARVLADLDRAGDEPLMLARALPGVPVLVGADRYLCGPSGRSSSSAPRSTCSTTGFSICALARDVDLLLVDEDDLDRPRAAGRPAARAARQRRGRRRRAACTAGDDAGAAAHGAARSACRPSFRVARALGAPRMVLERTPSPCRRRARCSRSPASRGRSASSPISRRPAGRSSGTHGVSAIIIAFTAADVDAHRRRARARQAPTSC